MAEALLQMHPDDLPKSYEPTEVERRWYQFWMERGYFTADANSTEPPYSIILPPPNVTGSLHLGHALTATLEDILIRWKRMSGFNCLWLPGIDHAGISTQLMVEREIKKTEGKDRHQIGRAEFLKRVWAWKEKYGRRIAEQHQVLGASLDWTRERFTMDPGSSLAVRRAFVQLYDEGLIYKAKRLINWCPSCRTALSDLEVEHEEVDGALWRIRYPIKDSHRYLVVATTRPETMLGDTAVAVHPKDPRYQGLIDKSAILPLLGREIPIIGDEVLVDLEFGTGAVKVTPGHDFNDYQVGLRHNLPMISIFDENARTNANAGPYAGLDRYDARKRVLEDLTAQGLLDGEEKHRHSIGICQRSRTVVEPMLSAQWFVKIEPLAKPAIEAVEQGRTRFVPESWTATYFQWMRNIHDWCISRQLWWGHQIPAYYCVNCRRTAADCPPIVALEPPRQCPVCGGHELEQDPDVLDTWFSSGLWPFSTLGWPQQTEDLKTFYPTSVMETGHDIIFFWVARMMMLGLHFMKDVPFRTVYLHAMIRDEKGQKMSKTKGNVIDPLDIILGGTPEQLSGSVRNKFPQGMPAFGADALRFTLARLTQQGRDIKLSLDAVDGYKAFGNKLWNASRFALINLGDFQLGPGHVKDLPLSLADRWILSRVNQAITQVGRSLAEFQFSEAASSLYQFLWGEFCDWYIELAKGALYGEEPEAKKATRSVLVFSLDQILRLLHPFMPFITEEIWQKIPIRRTIDSIMVSSFPSPDERLADAEAEAQMAPLIEVIENIRRLRSENKLAPATKVPVLIASADPRIRDTLRNFSHYLIPLAGLSSLEIRETGPKPAQAAPFVGSGVEGFVLLSGLIDFTEERGRLSKEIAKVTADLEGLSRKLGNPNFVSKAPADVVQKDRARLEELQLKKAKLQEHLGRINADSPPAG